MGRLSPNERALAYKMRRQGIPIKLILRTRFDIDKNVKCKITIEVELAILFMRNSFKWGILNVSRVGGYGSMRKDIIEGLKTIQKIYLDVKL